MSQALLYRRRCASAALVAIAFGGMALPLQGWAQDAYPSKTIRFVVPYPLAAPPT